MGWVITPGGTAVNLDNVTFASVQENNGNVKVAFAGGASIVVSMGTDDASASEALARVVTAKSLSDYV